MSLQVENQADAMGEQPRHIVVTVHGIRTFAPWQERPAKLLKESDPSINSISYKYLYYSAVAFWTPRLHQLEVRKFRKELNVLRMNHPNARLDLVGHSFGTHLIGHALRQLSGEGINLRIDTIILCGSVLRSDFPWRGLIDAGRVRRVINECGENDIWVKVSQIRGFGMAGFTGFRGTTDGETFCNRYHRFGHSGFFEPDGPESHEDDFMRREWIPLLTQDAPPTPRLASSPNLFQGLGYFI